MGTQLLDLPSELIVAITEHLANNDILRLRLVCSSLGTICDFTVKHLGRRLYLHPKSVAYAIRFCDAVNSRWHQNVTEVIICGISVPAMRSLQEGRGNRATPPDVDSPAWRLNLHTWSQFPPHANGSERELTHEELVDYENNTFEENYASLLEGLARLTNVRTIRYAGHDYPKPGFCQVSYSTSLKLSKLRDHWQSCFGGDEQPSLRAALRTVWWNDAHVFTAALLTFESQLDAIEIEQPMPVVGNGRKGGIAWPSPVPHTNKIGENVKRLQITIPGSGLWRRFLQCTVDSLFAVEELEIDIRSGLDEAAMEFKKRSNGPVDRSLLWETDTEHDRTLLDAVPTWDQSLKKLTVRSLSSCPYSLPSREVEQFLVKFRASLQHVSLHNIVFFETDMYGHRPDVRDGMASIVQCLKTLPELETCSLRIPKLGCYKHGSEEAHNDACGKYTVRAGFEDLRTFETLAHDYGVELHDGMWDFAPKLRSE